MFKKIQCRIKLIHKKFLKRSLNVSKIRLGSKSNDIKWLVGDITNQNDLGKYDIWHDRAVFHFLTDEKDRSKYIKIASNTIPIGGHIVIGTFALDGPEKCSDLPICRYDENSLSKIFEPSFKMLSHYKNNHVTPWHSIQSFIFVILRKI